MINISHTIIWRYITKYRKEKDRKFQTFTKITIQNMPNYFSSITWEIREYLWNLERGQINRIQKQLYTLLESLQNK